MSRLIVWGDVLQPQSKVTSRPLLNCAWMYLVILVHRVTVPVPTFSNQLVCIWSGLYVSLRKNSHGLISILNSLSLSSHTPKPHTHTCNSQVLHPILVVKLWAAAKMSLIQRNAFTHLVKNISSSLCTILFFTRRQIYIHLGTEANNHINHRNGSKIVLAYWKGLKTGGVGVQKR